MSRLPARRPSATYKLQLLAAGQEGHVVHVTLGYDPDTGALAELFFCGRGKAGHGLDQLLMDLGVQVSRVIQGRDPATGEEPA